MILYEKRLRQLEEAEQNVAKDIHEFYKDKNGTVMKATQSPCYISNKVLGGKSHINAFGSKQAMGFSLMLLLTFITEELPADDELYGLDLLCEEYNRRHNTDFGRNK